MRVKDVQNMFYKETVTNYEMNGDECSELHRASAFKVCMIRNDVKSKEIMEIY